MIDRFAVVMLVTLAFGVLFVGIEMLAKGTKSSGEIVRKLAHIISGVFAALFPMFLSYQEIAVVGVLLTAGVAISINRKLFTSVRQVERVTYGEILFPLGITVVALLFPSMLLYTFAIFTLALADALASVVGTMYGRRTFSLLGSHKSYAGSLTFFVVTWALGIMLILGLSATSYISAVLVGGVLAAMLTVVEAASSKGIDNLSVPVAAASLLWVAQVGGFIG